EMVNAGLVPATVTISIRADFWAKGLPHLTLHPNIVVKADGQLAWATRKDSPQLRQILDEFVKGRAVGTSFGNPLVRRYPQNTEWVKDATSSEEMNKFQTYVRYFQKYAVGIMQVIPKYAAAPPISISNVEIAEYNIEAGAKMLRNIADTYFNDGRLDPLNKTLLTFASYNAGPNRI